MHIPPMLLIHICGAVIGLLSGFLAMALRKGSGLHAAAGNVFFVSMLAMSSSGAYVAWFLRPNKANFLVAVLTFYLVTTAWVAARRRDGKTGLFDRAALLLVAADGVAGWIWGLQAAGNPRGLKDGMPAFLYFFFGSIALFCAVRDFRRIRRGGDSGVGRLVRHLSRMCFALLIATFSLYPGQAKLFSPDVRATNLLFVPHLLLVGSLLFWAVRMRRAKRGATVKAAALVEPLLVSYASTRAGQRGH